jgi:hypothetical protein
MLFPHSFSVLSLLSPLSFFNLSQLRHNGVLKPLTFPCSFPVFVALSLLSSRCSLARERYNLHIGHYPTPARRFILQSAAACSVANSRYASPSHKSFIAA